MNGLGWDALHFLFCKHGVFGVLFCLVFLSIYRLVGLDLCLLLFFFLYFLSWFRVCDVVG